MASSAVRVRDLRLILEIVGECRDLGDEAARWTSHLARRAAPLIDGDHTVTGFFEDQALAVVRAGTPEHGDPRGREQFVEASGSFQVAWGWENGFHPEAYLRLHRAVIARGEKFHPLMAAYLAARDRDDGVALSREDVVRDPDWFRSECYRDFIEPAAAGPIVMNYRRGRHVGGSWCLIVTRTAGRRDYTARQKAILRELNAAIAPLVGGPLAQLREPSPAALAPRVRAVLKCFLEGDSDKQVAKRLGISTYTVNQYAKVIYRHFAVASRAELLARWVRRGWGNRFAWADE